YSRFFGTLHVPGPWAVALSVAPANLERAVARCREIVSAYVEEGPTEEELAEERTAQAGSYRVGLATNAGVARELAAALAAGFGPEYLDTYPERLLAASREEVAAALRRHIRPGSLSLAAAGSLAG
ncbi:MAG: insulinase family protein, partial [Nitrospirae bacterium]